MAALDRTKVLNFNVGVLGHIDSGKTSLGMPVINKAMERIVNQKLVYVVDLSIIYQLAVGETMHIDSKLHYCLGTRLGSSLGCWG